VHCFAPPEEKVPAAQLAHDPTPAVALNAPALQFRQVDWPVLDWKVPSAQLAQAGTFEVPE